MLSPSLNINLISKLIEKYSFDIFLYNFENIQNYIFGLIVSCYLDSLKFDLFEYSNNKWNVKPNISSDSTEILEIKNFLRIFKFYYEYQEKTRSILINFIFQVSNVLDIFDYLLEGIEEKALFFKKFSSIKDQLIFRDISIEEIPDNLIQTPLDNLKLSIEDKYDLKDEDLKEEVESKTLNIINEILLNGSFEKSTKITLYENIFEKYFDFIRNKNISKMSPSTLRKIVLPNEIGNDENPSVIYKKIDARIRKRISRKLNKEN